MNIDERLDRLTERHEALTQTVEIVARMQRTNEEALEKVHILLTKVVETVANLVRVAEGHERRISRLEEGRP
jgi:archaellum component FlaC